jgi:hypothetical protein
MDDVMYLAATLVMALCLWALIVACERLGDRK